MKSGKHKEDSEEQSTREETKREDHAMGSDNIIAILRQTIATAFFMGAPLLIAATLVGLLINVVQVLTSLQETTLSTVPRLFAVAAATFLLLPWMAHRLTAFSLQIFSDFRPFAQ
jgi:flagellar biosynthetic protein FliQ